MSDERETPKRHTLSSAYQDQHEALIAALTRRTSGGSVKFSPALNAKGDVQGGLDIYAELGTDLEALEQLAEAVVRIGAKAFRNGVEMVGPYYTEGKK